MESHGKATFITQRPESQASTKSSVNE